MSFYYKSKLMKINFRISKNKLRCGIYPNYLQMQSFPRIREQGNIMKIVIAFSSVTYVLVISLCSAGLRGSLFVTKTMQTLSCKWMFVFKSEGTR